MGSDGYKVSSSEKSKGIIIANGSVGEKLDIGNLNTYISGDAVTIFSFIFNILIGLILVRDSLRTTPF